MYDNLSDIFTLYMIQKKMPTKCSVKNCKYYYGAGETMFKIPVPCPQSCTVKNEKSGRTMMAFMKEHLSFINDFILCENDMTSSAIFINYSSI